jgi:hypothetical protein
MTNINLTSNALLLKATKNQGNLKLTNTKLNMTSTKVAFQKLKLISGASITLENAQVTYFIS